ncbi:hypothetical protein [Chryseobacterium flavum]|uniref:hypothetical protein n=1 Tax=Chryseobacterium flavum TaxID=415851 RepID=UPI0028AC2F64|nr:hypothetical protein [Chryseobacterium flavum]
MNKTNVNHTFFIDKIEKLDFCGKEIYSLKGGRYTQPYDIVKLEYQGHKHFDCVSCKSNYATVLKDVTNYHK